MFNRMLGPTGPEWKRLRNQAGVIATIVFTLSIIFGLVDGEGWVVFLASLLGMMSLTIGITLYIFKGPRLWLVAAFSVGIGISVGILAALYFSNGLYY